MKGKISTIIMILLAVSLVPIGFAHLDAGKDKVIDDYLIDFGYSPESPKATDRIEFAFNLINNTTKDIIEPASAWIRISSSKEVVFAGTVHSEAKHVAFAYMFPYADDYDIKVRFKTDETVIVEADFEIKVGKAPYKYVFVGVKSLIIILLISAIVFVWKNKHKREVKK